MIDPEIISIEMPESLNLGLATIRVAQEISEIIQVTEMSYLGLKMAREAQELQRDTLQGLAITQILQGGWVPRETLVTIFSDEGAAELEGAVRYLESFDFAGMGLSAAAIELSAMLDVHAEMNGQF